MPSSIWQQISTSSLIIHSARDRNLNIYDLATKKRCQVSGMDKMAQKTRRNISFVLLTPFSNITAQSSCLAPDILSVLNFIPLSDWLCFIVFLLECDKMMMSSAAGNVNMGFIISLSLCVCVCWVDSVWLCLVVFPDCTQRMGSTCMERARTPRRPEHSNSLVPLCSSCLEMLAATNKVRTQIWWCLSKEVPWQVSQHTARGCVFHFVVSHSRFLWRFLATRSQVSTVCFSVC